MATSAFGTHTLTRAQFDDLVAQFDPDTDIRDDYSGRVMWGGRCIGYVGDDPIPFAFELALLMASDPDDYGDPTADDIRDAYDRMGQMRGDGMGRETIWYWPDVHVEPEADDIDASA